FIRQHVGRAVPVRTSLQYYNSHLQMTPFPLRKAAAPLLKLFTPETLPDPFRQHHRKDRSRRSVTRSVSSYTVHSLISIPACLMASSCFSVCEVYGCTPNRNGKNTYRNSRISSSPMDGKKCARHLLNASSAAP